MKELNMTILNIAPNREPDKALNPQASISQAPILKP